MRTCKVCGKSAIDATRLGDTERRPAPLVIIDGRWVTGPRYCYVCGYGSAQQAQLLAAAIYAAVRERIADLRVLGDRDTREAREPCLRCIGALVDWSESLEDYPCFEPRVRKTCAALREWLEAR